MTAPEGASGPAEAQPLALAQGGAPGLAGGPQPGPAAAEAVALGALAWVFFKLGVLGFGGPAAHVAMMEEEVVRRRAWVTREHFLDLWGATHLVPGPNSTELAIHLGLELAGWRGCLVAGLCFILPAAFIVGAIAWAYVAWGALPQVAGLLVGIQPVILAVVLQALWGLGKSALKGWGLRALAAAVALAYAGGLPELLLLFLAGGGLALRAWWAQARTPQALAGVAATPSLLAALGAALLPAASAPVGAVATAAGAPSLGAIFAFFLKVGSVLFGSGYVLLAFLRADLVQRWGWLSEAQLLDAIAVGQVTPGPVFTTATFIGWLLAGPAGAAVATVGIFLPAFAFVAISRPWLPWLRRHPVASAALDGVNAASWALLAVVACQLGVGAIQGPTTAGLGLLAAVALLCLGLNSAWLVLAGGLAGWALGLGASGPWWLQ